MIFEGITAHYLIKSTWQVKPGTTILLYGAAGALGQILAPWASHLGARVICVVAKQADTEPAEAAGCESAIVWSEDLPSELEKRTNGRKADVVYDGVGLKTFATSINSLGARGMLVSSGAPPVEVGTLNAKGSPFLTRPGLAHHATDIVEYRQRMVTYSMQSKRVSSNRRSGPRSRLPRLRRPMPPTKVARLLAPDA